MNMLKIFHTNSARMRRFKSDRSGNIAMIFVLMSGVLFLFVGGALDYSRWNAVRTDMMESMDAATLAVSKLYQDDDTLTASEINEIGNKFFEENAQLESALEPGASVTFALQSDGNIETCMTAKIKTYLLGVVDIPELNIDKCVRITPDGAGRVELAMVLDVTGSMSGQKMTDLKSAAGELLTVLYRGDTATTSDNVRLGVVPFNQHVNVGGASSWDDANWGDQNALSVYHGARFFHVDQTGTVDMSTKVNHYRLYDSDPNRSWEGCVEARPYPLDEMDTAPGVAITAADISAAMLTPSYADEPDSTVRDAFTNAPAFPHGMTATMLASADNSRFVPVFLPDEPDCGYNEDCDNGDYGENYNTSGAWSGVRWHGYWYDDPDSGHSESAYSNRQYIYDYRYTNWTQGDPFHKYARVVAQQRTSAPNPASVSNNSYSVDLAFREWMNFYGATSGGADEYIVRTGYPGYWNPGTNTYVGKYDLTKGQSWDGPNPGDCPPAVTPLTDDRTVIQAAIDALTTNGGTNIPNGAMWGWRVISDAPPFTESIGASDTGPNNTGEGDWQRAVLIMTDGNNDFADRSTHWGSSISAYGYEMEERMGDGVDEADDSTNTDMEGNADTKLLRICRRMKQEGILVYTIVFDVSVGSTIEGIMQSCASEPNAPFFYNAATGADLEEAFGDIAADLVSLHVSQ